LELNEWYGGLVHVISISKCRLEIAVAEITRLRNIFKRWESILIFFCVENGFANPGQI